MSTRQDREVPFEDGFTWVSVTTPDRPVTGALPLIVLHGGPGFTHHYLKNLRELADRSGRMIVHYDQYGCGLSTHRPDAPADYWTPELFVREFHNVVDALGIERYHVLGQSWGGMLGAEIAVRRPAGLVSLAICNSPASMDLWTQAADQLIAELPAEIRDTLRKYEAAEDYENPEYIAASHEYDKRHVVRLPQGHPDYEEAFEAMQADPTVYYTMNGPNEFHVVGTMQGWTIIDRLDQIEVPTLVLAGEFDEAQPIVWEPFVEHIPDARSHVIAGASHCSHLEQPEEFFGVVCEFMKDAETTGEESRA